MHPLLLGCDIFQLSSSSLLLFIVSLSLSLSVASLPHSYHNYYNKNHFQEKRGMPFSLPPVPCHVQEPLPSSLQNKSKPAKLRLPSWDRVACIKLEPLEPPSPYRPVIPKRPYPSVVSCISRMAQLRSEAGKRQLMPIHKAMAALDTSYEMMLKLEEASQLRLFKEEREERDGIIFWEQHDWTHLWVDSLQRISILMEDDVFSAEEDARGANEREEERERMCFEIEMKSIAARIQKRMQDRLRNKLKQLMPLHKAECDNIMKEEANELADILLWFKNKRPFGMRLPAFLLGGQQQQQHIKRSARRSKKCQNVKGTKGWMPRASGNLTVTHDVKRSSDPFLETSYLEEGRKAWRCSRDLAFKERKSRSSPKEVSETETTARAEILAEEALAWIPILRRSVDEYHEIQRQMQIFDQMELKMVEERIQELKKRELIFSQLEENAAAAAACNKDVVTGDTCSAEVASMKQREDATSVVHVAVGDPAMQLHVSGVAGEVDPGEVAHQDASTSWGSESSTTVLHPMLNIVLDIALERDPYVALRNTTLSSLGEAECALAACEGYGVGSATRAFAAARHIPLCPLYLVQQLWHERPSMEDLHLISLADNAATHPGMQRLLTLEMEERKQLVDKQIIAIWSLYRKAAEDMSRVMGTKTGDMFYVGVCMPSEI